MIRTEPVVYMFTGIEGSGKTLSAFEYSIKVGNREKKQLFVSDDNYHIGAREQFQTLCDVVGCEGWHVKHDKNIIGNDSILDYDEVYFDSSARSQESEKTRLPMLYGISSIRRILVLHMLALFDENLSKHHSGDPELPDEYIITFCDLFPSLNDRNKDRINESADRLCKKRTVWISNGSSFPDGFYQYGGSL
jgi:hypothetical protein